MVQHAPEVAQLMREAYLFKRGEELPQTKITDAQVIEIRAAADQRRELREWIAANLSNDALASRYDVHLRTIEKILARETHFHVR
jgi:hypothetical protein